MRASWKSDWRVDLCSPASRVFTAFEYGMNIGFALRQASQHYIAFAFTKLSLSACDLLSLWKGYYVLIMDNIARQIHPAEWKRVTFILYDQFRIASLWYILNMNMLSKVSILKYPFLNLYILRNACYLFSNGIYHLNCNF